jgi:RNA polymerase sigma-70 factor (ECF subfamily)
MRHWISRLRTAAPPPTPSEAQDSGPVSGPRTAPPRPSYDEIFRTKHKYVLGTLWRLGIERECDREDIAQEVFLVILRRLSDYDPTLKIEAWLGQITWYKALQWKQLYRNHREQLRAEGVDEDDAVDEDAQNPETVTHAQRYARALLQTLPDERQIVFLLHEQDGVSVLDIARAFALPKGTVETRLKLARRDLLAAARRLRAQERGAQLPLVIPIGASMLGNDPGSLLDVLRTVPDVPAGTEARLWRHLQHARDSWAGGGGSSPSTPDPRGGSRLLPSQAGLERMAKALVLAVMSAALGGGGVYLLLRRAPEPIAQVAPVDVSAARVSVMAEAAPEPVALVETRPATTPVDAGPEPIDPLDSDAALMRRATAALGDGQPAAALALAQRHAKKYPGSRRLQEREALAIRALASLGRRSEAEAHAESFRRAYPQSLLLNAIDSALGAPPPKL